MRFFMTALVSAAMLMSGPTLAQDRSLVQKDRMESKEVEETLIQGLLTLADMRIRDRPGKDHPYFDSCSTGDGCRSILPFADPRNRFGLPTPPLWPKIRNYPGEWASSIHALTQLIKMPQGQAPVTVPDANMFVTASILYPLVFVKEADKGPVRAMIEDALTSIKYYKRGAGYSFWREQPSSTAGYRVIGPLNIPHQILDVLTLAIRSARPIPPDHGAATRPGWVQAIADKSINPIGSESFFNIPSDADDTALAMIAYRLFDPDSRAQVRELAELVLKHRDVSRTFEDTRDGWKGKNSGAFLTWLKDESLPIREAFNSKDGIIPFGINNVDCVVNANVVFALGLAGYGKHPAVTSTLGILNRAVDLESWPYCGLYYPHKMMFPYALTRAYRDGGLSHPGMKAAMGRLVVRLIADQKETRLREPKRDGAFSGGADQTYDLATALAVNALLNIGREIPTKLGIAAGYDQAIASGIKYLVSHKVLSDVRYPDAIEGLYQPGLRAALWEPGLFFTASVQRAAGWRSEGYTAAIAVEALAKYLLAWDRAEGGLHESGALSVQDGALNFLD